MLAMTILQDALEGFEIECNIKPEDHILKGIRFEEVDFETNQEDRFLYLFNRNDSVVLKSFSGEITVKNTNIDIIYKRICETSEMLDAWKEDLDKMNFYNCTIQELSTRSQSVIKNAFFVTDESNHVLALSSHPPGTVTKEWDYIVKNRRMIVEVVQDIFNDEPFRKNFYAKFEKAFYYKPKSLEFGSVSYRINYPNSNGYMGTLVVLENKEPFLKGVFHYTTIFGAALSFWVKLHYKESPMASASIAFKNIVDGEVPTESQKILLASIIESKNSLYKILAIHPFESNGIESYIFMFEENFYDCVFCDYNNTILILCCEKNCDSLINSIRLLLKDRIEPIGVSEVFSDFDILSGFAKQALFSQEYSINQVGYFDSECAIKLVSKELQKERNIKFLLNSKLEELINHDKKHNTEYCFTLYTFLRKERSISDSLPILNIHRNSMIYRLKRIDELIDVDLENFYVREHLLLSFELLGLYNKESLANHN